MMTEHANTDSATHAAGHEPDQHDGDATGTGGPEPGRGSAPDSAPESAPSSESARQSPPVRPTVEPASRAPHQWGSVGSDGTVYARTTDGDRAIGSWQAGTADEGLAHFARRFDDLLTEAELIESRLASGATDPKQAASRIATLRDEVVKPPAAVGDLNGLAALLDYLDARAHQRIAEAKAAKEEARSRAVEQKTALVEEAEWIAAESTQWKASGDRLRAIVDEWKSVRGVDRKTDDVLWRRFGKARDTFNRRRGAHFAELDRQRALSRARKEELVAEAEGLMESSDWAATAARFKELMAEWKAAGRAPKEADDALWQRFRGAQDGFFQRRNAAFSQRDAELADNARAKEALLGEAEALDPAAGVEDARAALRRIQQRWDAAGKVPRDRVRELEGRFRAVEDKIRSAGEAQWRRADPEALARVAQFRERAEQFESQAAKARSAGDERRAKQAEEQAAQWREWLAAAENALSSR